MRTVRRRLVTLAVALAVLDAHGAAEDGSNPAAQTGAQLYRRYCAACHGPNVRGDGPVSPALAQKVPDLTTMTDDAGGTFPFVRVAAAIDGRTEIRAHGVTDMPVWGEALGAHRREKATTAAPDEVLLITEYLRTIQR